MCSGVLAFRRVLSDKGEGKTGDADPAPSRLDEDGATPMGGAWQGRDGQFGCGKGEDGVDLGKRWEGREQE